VDLVLYQFGTPRPQMVSHLKDVLDNALVILRLLFRQCGLSAFLQLMRDCLDRNREKAQEDI